MRKRLAWATAFSLLAVPSVLDWAQQAKTNVTTLPPPAKVQVDFARDIEPVFEERCYNCHGAREQKSGLRLDTKAGALAGGNSGPLIKQGSSAESKLIHMVSGMSEPVMPLGGERLTSAQVGLLRAWIDQGAVWPEKAAFSPEARKPGSPSSPGGVREQPGNKHWAFIPPQRSSVPKVHNQAWVRNPIDAFVLAKLEAERVSPSPEADRATLIRRASLDLIGLPPTPREVAEFVADKRSDAYERLIESLLSSPHYGEKWARQWLDLAHYADSDGYEKDWVRPYAWRWRDWVIDALNKNMPFDQFTIEQVAGDLLPNATAEQRIATGFFRNTLTNREGGVDPEEYRVEQVVDRTSTLGTTWLALTVGCARCHDHKYDPISQREFYQLTAFFNTAKENNIEVPLPGELGTYLQEKAEYRKKRAALLAEYKVPQLYSEWEKRALPAAAHPGADPTYDAVWANLRVALDEGEQMLLTPPHLRTEKQQDKLFDFFVRYYAVSAGETKYKELKFDELNDKLEYLKQQYPRPSEAQTLIQNRHPPKTHILVRGNYRQPGIEVQPGTPAVVNPLAADPNPSRLTLARWLVSKKNPLTARVWVSRAWQEFFRHGLVETSGDFGSRGEPPSHPQLLDWLATEFMSNGWNMKQMHRLIVQSATYRQSSKARPDLETRDPENRLLARQVRLRLPAELIRDSALCVSGLLNPAIGGKSVEPPQPNSVVDLGFVFGPPKWKGSSGPERYRRGLYVKFLRATPYPLLANFDAPDTLLSCTRRERSTTPLQALNLLNDPVFVEAAQVLAARILHEERGSWDDRLNYAFQLCLARDPRPQERERLARHYARQKEILARYPDLTDALFGAKDLEGIDANEAAFWVGITRVLLNLDEFITRS